MKTIEPRSPTCSEAYDRQSTWACLARHLERLEELERMKPTAKATQQKIQSASIARRMLELLRIPPDLDAIEVAIARAELLAKP